MNAIDIFLELLDEKDLYYICKQMKININDRSNKELYKIRLRQKFKTGNKSFDNFIMQNRDEEIAGLTEREYLVFLRYIGKNNYSNDKKLINLLGHYPKLAEEYISKISENLNSDRHLYDFDIIFEDEEIENLFNKTFKNNDEKSIIKLSDSILNFIIEENILDVSKVKDVNIEKVKNYTLKDLFQNRDKISDEEELLSKYFYIKTHDIAEPLYSRLLLNIYYDFLHILEPSILKIKDMEENKNLLSQNEKYKKENKELKRKMNRYEQKQKKAEKIFEENEKYKKIIQSKEKKINKYKEDMEELSSLIKEVDDNQIKIKKLNSQYKNVVNEFNCYIESLNSGVMNKNILLITERNIELIEKLYGKEIILLSINELEKKNQLMKENKEIKGILIERIGISSNSIISIKKQFIKEGILMKIINPNDDKELLEEIVIMKEDIRRKI